MPAGSDSIPCRFARVRPGPESRNTTTRSSLTSSFVFTSAREAAARFAGEEPGNVYSRFTNPTVRAFERRLAALEGGTHCIATASGMAAIHMTAMALLRCKEHMVAAKGLFGTTTSLFANVLTRFGIETTSST